MSILIVDYGMGNLASVRRALEECGASALVSSDPSDLATCSRIIIPGVGSFTDAMSKLTARGWVEPLRRASTIERIPTLGICLGMQLLASSGKEGGMTQGLDLVPGTVERLEPTNQNERVPHVGWNRVDWRHNHSLHSDIAAPSDFYFVHSYVFRPIADTAILATTPYCGEFVSAIAHGAVAGFQFHPEKSSRAGFQLLKNFMSWNPDA